MKKVLICLDGPNCVGKSTLRKLLFYSLRDIGFLVECITDEEVNLKKGYDSYGVIRKNIRDDLFSKGVDIIIQERGILSHFVFDHYPPGNSKQCILCNSYNEIPTVYTIHIVLIAPAHVLLKRSSKRINFMLAMDFLQQEKAFKKAAKSLNLKILTSIYQIDLDYANQNICLQIISLFNE